MRATRRLKSSVAEIEHWAIAILLLVAAVGSARAHEPEVPPTAMQTYVQAWLGTTEDDNLWSLDDSSADIQLAGDHSSLLFGGGVSQSLWGANAQYGFEGGGLLSFSNDAVAFTGADPGLRVSIDNEFFYAEVFMGGVISLRPAPWVRFYAAAGPALAWGFLNGDDYDHDDDDDTVVVIGPGSVLVIDLDESHGDYSLAPYGRVGVDFELDSGFTFGVSARYVEHDMDFDERGELELDNVYWFLTLGARI